MLELATGWLIVLFLAGATVTWAAGVKLSGATDALDARLGIGEAVGGLVLLAVAGTLPELAITVAAASQGNLALAAGNLIGGIAVQTMVLVLCDFAAGKERPLTYLVGSLSPVLEGLLVVLVVAGVLMGTLLPPSTAIGGVVSPASLAIVVIWIAGIVILDRTRDDPHWAVIMPGSHPGRRRHARRTPRGRPKHASGEGAQSAAGAHTRPYAGVSTARVARYFALACLATLVAGVALELSAESLAARAGINGVVFGATFLALATALPEISSGIAAVRLGDNVLAVGDVFGGNAFQVCLFLLADLIAGRPVLPAAGRLNGWLAALGIALTAVFCAGIVLRPGRTFARLGPDSLVAIAIFALGMAGLALLPA